MSAIGIFNPAASSVPAAAVLPNTGAAPPKVPTDTPRGVSATRVASSAVGDKPWVDATAFGSIDSLTNSAALAYRVESNGGVTIIGNNRPLGAGAGFFLRGLGGSSLLAPYASIREVGEQIIDRMATSGMPPRPFQLTFQLSPKSGFESQITDRSRLVDTMIGLQNYAAQRGLEKAFFNFQFSK
jgi:hypothetical protein